MKENTNNKHNQNNEQIKSREQVEANLADDIDVAAVAVMNERENTQRKVALLCSLMVNMFFLVTAYTILCYDTTGRLFGRLLGVNL
ncbi:MAG: hypothetical protein Q4C83_03410 [Candidatus Saccharibacteria bacterium]|nr:hypothetical protein [Candidatus Saccharibacteria bacterium]